MILQPYFHKNSRNVLSLPTLSVWEPLIESNPPTPATLSYMHIGLFINEWGKFKLETPQMEPFSQRIPTCCMVYCQEIPKNDFPDVLETNSSDLKSKTQRLLF